MSLPNPGMNFTPFDVLPASDLNDIVENIEALADGSGLDDGAIGANKIDFSTFPSIFSTPIRHVTQTTTDRTKNGSTYSAIAGTSAQNFTSMTGMIKIQISAIHRVNTETGRLGVQIGGVNYPITQTNLTSMAPHTAARFFAVTPGVATTITPIWATQSGSSTLYISAYTDLEILIEDVL